MHLQLNKLLNVLFSSNYYTRVWVLLRLNMSVVISMSYVNNVVAS